MELQSSVTGKSNDSSYETSLIIDKLSKLLSKVDNLITLHPAHDSVSRFGKIEFRDFIVICPAKLKNTFLRLLRRQFKKPLHISLNRGEQHKN